MSVLQVRTSGAVGVILLVAAALSAVSASAQVNIAFESPTYSGGNIIGQDGWVQNGYVTPAVLNGTTTISGASPLGGSQSLLYTQTSAPSGFAAGDVSKANVITVLPGRLGADLTVSYLLQVTPNALGPAPMAGLFLSHDAAAVTAPSPVFARINGTTATMEVGNGGGVTPISGFTYFGEVLDVKYDIDFDTATYAVSATYADGSGPAFSPQTFNFFHVPGGAPTTAFVPEGPNGEYIIDVGALFRSGIASIDNLTLAPGTGEFVEELSWAGDASGNWNNPASWSPGGIPGTLPGRQTAVFGDAISSVQTVYNNSSRSVNGVEFNNANSYIVAGTGSIALEADTSGGPAVLPTIDVTSGDHEFQIAVNLLNDTTVTVAPGASLAFNNQIDLGGNTLTTSGNVSINHSTVGSGTIVSLGSLTTSSVAAIGGDLVSMGALSVGVYEGGAGAFNVLGDATLSGVFDVLWDTNSIPSGTLTVLSAGGILDASDLSLAADDAHFFVLGTDGNDLTLTYVGFAVPEPVTLGAMVSGIFSLILLRRNSLIASRTTIIVLACTFATAALQSASAELIDFESPTYSTGNLIGQDGWMQLPYITPAALNGTVTVSSSSPLVGSQSLLYTQTSEPVGFNGSDVGKPSVAFGTSDGTTAVDLTASVRIQAGANTFAADRIGIFLSGNLPLGLSPIAVILNGSSIETLHTTGFFNTGSYTPNNVIEFQIGVNFDNADYEVSYRDITAGGPLTPLAGPGPGGRFGFFNSPTVFPSDGDGVTYTIDVGTFLRGGTGQIDSITVTGDDFVQATWAGDSGNWATNNSWIPQIVPNAPSGNGQIVVFGDRITAPQTVFTNTTQTVNGLRFNNINKYAIAGGGSVALKSNTIGGTVAPTIDVLNGAHELQVPISVLNNTTVTSAAGSLLDFNNTLSLGGNTLTISGAGVVNLNVGVTGGGSIVNSATLGTAGTTPVAANLTSTGKLQFNLGPANTDFFDITGNATLSGLLDVVLEPGFTPAGTYTVLTASGALNAAGLTLDPSDAGQFSLSVFSNSLRLTVGGGLQGDFDNDGDVDGRDFLVWQRGGSPSPLSAGDLAAWQANYGPPPIGALSTSVAVPEPSVFGLLAFSLVAGVSCFRRGRWFASYHGGLQ